MERVKGVAFCLPDDIVGQLVEAAQRSVLSLVQLWIFGSFARGDALEDSDIDLFFTYSGGVEDRLKNNLAFRRAVRPLMKSLGRDIDVVCMDEVAFKTSIERGEGLLPSIVAEEGVLIYG